MTNPPAVLFQNEYRDRSTAFTSGLSIAICVAVAIVAAQVYFRYEAEQNPRADEGTADLLRVVSVVAVCGTLIGVVKWFQRALWTLRATDRTIAWSGKNGLVEVDGEHIATIAFRTDDRGAGLTVVMDDGAMYSVPPLCLMNDVGRFCEVVHRQFPRIRVTYNDRPACDECGRPLRVPARQRRTSEQEDVFCKCANGAAT